MAYKYTSDIPDGFFAKLKALGNKYNFNPEHAMNVMLFESGVKSSSIHPTAPASGIFGKMWPTREQAVAFTKLNAEQQLDEYAKYMAQYTNVPKPRAENIYQLNFLPASAIPGQKHYRGTDANSVLAAKGGTGYGGMEGIFYRDNQILDADKDGAITVGDLKTSLDRVRKSNSARWEELKARLDAAPGVYYRDASAIAGKAQPSESSPALPGEESPTESGESLVTSWEKGSDEYVKDFDTAHPKVPIRGHEEE